MPRFVGQGVWGGGVVGRGAGGVGDLASWTDITSWREEGAPDM